MREREREREHYFIPTSQVHHDYFNLPHNYLKATSKLLLGAWGQLRGRRGPLMEDDILDKRQRRKMLSLNDETETETEKV